MSPEQAVGDRGLDARTDVYCAGRGALRDAGGRAAVHGRHDPGDPREAVHRARAERAEGAAERTRRRGPGHPEGAGAGGSRSFQHGRAVRAGAPRSCTPAPTARPPRPSPRRLLGARPRPGPTGGPGAAVALVLGILIGLGVLFAWRRSSSAAAGGTGPKVLAVLPFENLGDSADAYFADGVADEVRTKLAQVGGLEVIARGSSVEYRGTTKRPAEIARELGADYLLAGTVRWEKAPGAASRVRVTPELVDARPGEAARTRWSEQYDAALTNVFEVQAGIAGKVASALDVALADSVRDELASRPTGSLAAYDAFLQGEAASQSMIAQDAPTVRRAMAFYRAGGGARFGVRARLGPALPGARDVRTRTALRQRPPASRRSGRRSGPGRSRRIVPRGMSRCAITTGACRWTTARARDLRGRASAGPEQRRSAQRGGPRRAVAGPLGSRAGAIPSAPRRSIHARPTRRDVSDTRS